MPFAIGGHRGYALLVARACLLVADGTLSRVAVWQLAPSQPCFAVL